MYVGLKILWNREKTIYQKSDYTLGHASPDRQRDQGKQARQGSKRQGEEDLPAH